MKTPIIVDDIFPLAAAKWSLEVESKGGVQSMTESLLVKANLAALGSTHELYQSPPFLAKFQVLA